jgi:hypothetical protein
MTFKMFDICIENHVVTEMTQLHADKKVTDTSSSSCGQDIFGHLRVVGIADGENTFIL